MMAELLFRKGKNLLSKAPIGPYSCFHPIPCILFAECVPSPKENSVGI